MPFPRMYPVDISEQVNTQAAVDSAHVTKRALTPEPFFTPHLSQAVPYSLVLCRRTLYCDARNESSVSGSVRCRHAAPGSSPKGRTLEDDFETLERRDDCTGSGTCECAGCGTRQGHCEPAVLQCWQETMRTEEGAGWRERDVPPRRVWGPAEDVGRRGGGSAACRGLHGGLQGGREDGAVLELARRGSGCRYSLGEGGGHAARAMQEPREGDGSRGASE